MALSAEIRPAEFWQQTPRETFDIIGVYSKKETERNKEEWKRYRWLAMHILNISGKHLTRDIKEDDLFKFTDEIVKVDPEERRRQALATANYHAKMAPRICKRGKDGKALIYGEDN